MKNRLYNKFTAIKTTALSLIILFTIALAGCEDPVPTDYKPQYYVEAVLLVDEPIHDIVLMRSQPVSQKFDYAASLVRNAQVIIKSEGRSFELVIDNEGEKGYYYNDTSYKVKPNTLYELEVRTTDGAVITGSTTTPGRTSWTILPKDTIQYPKDSLNLPDREKIGWSKVQGINFYSVAVVCKDTLNYGMYLTPPTEERNRRIYKPWLEDQHFREISNWSFIANTETSVVWNVFKWYGLHDVYVYAPDWNFLQWMLQHFMSGTYNDLLTSIKGDGIGVFGSASRIKSEFFLLKNQP